MPRLAVLTGEVRAGKTTAALEVVELAREAGYLCGGFLSPDRLDPSGRKLGIDALSLTDGERRQARDQFLRDVRNRVRELTTRGYLDARDRTVDCLLLFIPNEQVYAFVQEHDREVLDDASDDNSGAKP